MNPLSLVSTIAHGYFLLNKRAKRLGESVQWTDAAAREFLNTLPEKMVIDKCKNALNFGS